MKEKKKFALKEKLLCLQKSQRCKGFSAISPHPLGFKEGRQVAWGFFHPMERQEEDGEEAVPGSQADRSPARGSSVNSGTD